MSGIYRITRDGELVGEERFAITSEGQIWRVEGTIELSWPVAQQHRYLLEVDEATAEPLAFEVWMELAGEAQHIRGDQDSGYFKGQSETVLGKADFEIAYAQGTVIDFASPLFNTLALSLLLPSLEPGRPVAVRTIAVSMPALRPSIVLQRYLLVGMEGELRKVAVAPPHPVPKPLALWVRADGLPVRVRTWAQDGGPPFELRLVP